MLYTSCPSASSLAKAHITEGFQYLNVTWEAAVIAMSVVSQWAELGWRQSTQSWSQLPPSPSTVPGGVGLLYL